MANPTAGQSPTYGSQVQPQPPTQDMTTIDVLAGQADEDRDSNPTTFTAGMGGQGLGGSAEAGSDGSPPAGNP